MKTIEAIILAGGHSHRMGTDKALLPVQGVALISRVFEAAQPCCSRVWVVTPWPERYRQILPASSRFVLEQRPVGPAPGPLAGFVQGLAPIQSAWVLLLACDLPCLQPGFLESGMQQLHTLDERFSALLPRHSKGWDPLCGFYRRRCELELSQYLAEGGRSFQAWLATQPIAEWTVSDVHWLFNCNTPEDLAQLQGD
jgi:molybdopterin-guanine dinucleotide biosynthesis protein A